MVSNFKTYSVVVFFILANVSHNPVDGLFGDHLESLMSILHHGEDGGGLSGLFGRNRGRGRGNSNKTPKEEDHDHDHDPPPPVRTRQKKTRNRGTAKKAQCDCGALNGIDNTGILHGIENAGNPGSHLVYSSHGNSGVQQGNTGLTGVHHGLNGIGNVLTSHHGHLQSTLGNVGAHHGYNGLGIFGTHHGHLVGTHNGLVGHGNYVGHQGYSGIGGRPTYATGFRKRDSGSPSDWRSLLNRLMEHSGEASTNVKVKSSKEVKEGKGSAELGKESTSKKVV